MWKFIEKLQRLPEEARKSIVFFSSAGITALILVSWLIFPVPHFGMTSPEEEERKKAEDLLTPFAVIEGEVQGTVTEIKDRLKSFGGVGGIFSAVSAPRESATTSAATSTEKDFFDDSVLREQEGYLEERFSASTTKEAMGPATSSTSTATTSR